MTGFCSSSTVGPTAVLRGRGLAKRETGMPAAAAATATAGIVDYLAATCLPVLLGACWAAAGDEAEMLHGAEKNVQVPRWVTLA